AAMQSAERVVQVLAGLAFEDGVAVADLDETEGQRPGNRRRRYLAVDQGLHELPAGHAHDGLGLGAGRTVSSGGAHDAISLYLQMLYVHTIMTRRPQALAPTLVGDARAAVAACAGWASRLAARRITNFLEERMAGSGLSIVQFGLMAQIAA